MIRYTCSIIILVFIILIGNGALAKDEPMVVQVFTRQSIPFQQYIAPETKNNTQVIFSEYGNLAKATYPAPVDRVPSNVSEIIKKCRLGLESNIDDILRAQKNVAAVKNYLTAQNKISLLTKDGYFGLVDRPEEQNIQNDPETGKIIAEFRSKAVNLDKNTGICIYLTFVYDPALSNVEKIIISAERLMGRN